MQIEHLLNHLTQKEYSNFLNYSVRVTIPAGGLVVLGKRRKGYLGFVLEGMAVAVDPNDFYFKEIRCVYRKSDIIHSVREGRVKPLEFDIYAIETLDVIFLRSDIIERSILSKPGIQRCFEPHTSIESSDMSSKLSRREKTLIQNLERHDLRLTMDLLRDYRFKSGLDIGSGLGNFSEVLGEKCETVEAIDNCNPTVSASSQWLNAKGIDNVKLHNFDIMEVSARFKDISLVGCRLALHHIQEIDECLRKIREVLERDGLLVVTDILEIDPDVCEAVNLVEKWRDPSHHRVLCSSEFYSFLEESGFRIASKVESKRVETFPTWISRSGMLEEDGIRFFRNLRTDFPPAVVGQFLDFDKNNRVKSVLSRRETVIAYLC